MLLISNFFFCHLRYVLFLNKEMMRLIFWNNIVVFNIFLPANIFSALKKISEEAVNST